MATPEAALVECVPNFSEGRRAEVVREITAVIERVKGVTLLDSESDPDHNRSVVTFVGSPDQVAEAAFRATGKASELIDLSKHSGAHPRMGATDVVPFVPVSGVGMDECVELATRVGRRIGDELAIPVYLYESAAASPERRSLPKIRGAGFEALRDGLANGTALRPDFGPDRLHPTAGAVAVGARFFLIAYNVYLATNSTAVAKRVARKLRESDGGLPAVKALGMAPGKDGCAQVSMNLTDFRRTSIYRVFDAIWELAETEGVRIAFSEIVGLVPEVALSGDDPQRLALRGFTPTTQVLERKLEDTQRR